MKRRSTIFSILATIVALNYFAFRVELFEEEYEANHPAPASTLSFSMPTVTWETFDKDNAPQAFTVTVDTRQALLFRQPAERRERAPMHRPFSHVRDKSPPLFA